MNFIKTQIAQKLLSDNPYYSTAEDARQTITDHDHFPYTRWYRGDPALSVPVVAGRQAGWRIKHDNCYKQKQETPVDTKPNVCFQSPCNTIFPCCNSTQSCHTEKYNKSCVVQNY